MNLLVKFNLIFVGVFGLGLLIVGIIAQRFLEKAAHDQVVAQARLMMETSMAMRSYTTEHIQPVIEPRHRSENVFFPQIVPAYAATEAFNHLRKKYPDYTYKEATLNPTNPSDRATDWEADVVNAFRNNPKLEGYEGERDTPGGRSLYLAQPMVAHTACLECHSVPRRAPAAMIRQYGTANGFGWKDGEIVAAQIVSVPMALPLDMARREFKAFLLSLGLVGIFVLVVLNVTLTLAVVRPISRVAASAEQISKGTLNLPELPAKGKDEIADLVDSFNRMHRSLLKAMKLLEGE